MELGDATDSARDGRTTSRTVPVINLKPTGSRKLQYLETRDLQSISGISTTPRLHHRIVYPEYGQIILDKFDRYEYIRLCLKTLLISELSVIFPTSGSPPSTLT